MSNPQRLPSQRLLDAESPVATQLGPRRTILPWLLVAVLAAVVGGLAADRLRPESASPRADDGTADARTRSAAASGRRSLEATTDQQGNLVVRGVAEPVWPMPVTVPARADGVVTAIHVHPGDRVVPGKTPLLQLENRKLQLRLEEAAARLELAQTHFESVQEDQAAPELARLQDAVRIAEQQRNVLSDRYEAARVVSPDAVSPEELRRIKTELDLAEQRVDDARAAVEQLAERTARTRRLASEELAAIRAEHERMQLQVDALSVTTPDVEGTTALVVLTLPVRYGQSVSAGTGATTLCTLYDPTRMQIRVLVPARDLRKIELARILPGVPRGTVPSVPDDEFGDPLEEEPPDGERPSPEGDRVPRDAVSGDGADDSGRDGGAGDGTPGDGLTDGDSRADTTPPLSGPVRFRGGTECEIRPLAGGTDDDMRGWPVAVLPQADPELDAVTVLIRVETPSPTLRPGTPVRVRLRLLSR